MDTTQETRPQIDAVAKLAAQLRVDAIRATQQVQSGHVTLLAVRGMPGSGTPQELMRMAGIGVGDVVRAALTRVDGRVR